MNFRAHTTDLLQAPWFRSIVVPARALRSIGLTSLCILLLAIPLKSQDSKRVRQAALMSDSPFDGWNDSLEHTADDLLVSVEQVRPAIVNTQPAFEIGATTLASFSQIGSRPRQTIGAIPRLRSLRPFIDPVLQNAGVPTGLAAVILIESGGDPNALSPKGARGLWQLMPDTARRYGLEVSNIRDDRLDIVKSTQAAAGYLHDLYAQFHDWRLALAAYNTGEQNVERAITKGRTQNFAYLSSMNLLPTETRNYVPAVLAAIPQLGGQLAVDVQVSTPRPVTVFALTGE